MTKIPDAALCARQMYDDGESVVRILRRTALGWPPAERSDDDVGPKDIDEFRKDLTREIEALVASQAER